jgi:hypothetical protein
VTLNFPQNAPPANSGAQAQSVIVGMNKEKLTYLFGKKIHETNKLPTAAPIATCTSSKV